jgi:hypothetical protein
VILPLKLGKVPPLHTQVDLPSLVSIAVTGVCIPTSKCNILSTAVHKSPSSTWSDTDATKLLRLRNKSILASDLDAKHPFWNSTVPNSSRETLLQSLDANDFEISAQHPIQYFPAGNGDVLDIVVHQNIIFEHVIVFDILDYDQLPVIFYILDLITANKLLEHLKN